MGVDPKNELGTRGSEVYIALTNGRTLNAAHRAMILNAARIVDVLDDIDAELENAPLTVVNSQETETINPLITEARMLTGTLSQILAKLGVSELPEAQTGEKSRVDQLAEQRAKRRAGVRESNPEDSIQPASAD